MLTWVGDKRDEALEEGQRVEHERARAVAPRATQRPLHLAVPADLEPALRERGTSDIADDAFEPLAVFGLDAGRGVQRVPVELATELVGRHDLQLGGLHRERRIDEAWDRAARFGAERDLRLERGGLDEREERLRVVEATAVGRGVVVEDPAVAENALDPANGVALDADEPVVVEGRRQRADAACLGSRRRGSRDAGARRSASPLLARRAGRLARRSEAKAYRQFHTATCNALKFAR